MSTTAVLASAAAIGFCAQFVLSFVLLKFGARWARIPGATTARALVAILLIIIAQLGVNALCFIYDSLLPKSLIFGLLTLIIAGFGLPLLFIRLIFRGSWRQTMFAWLPTLLVPVLGVLFVFFLIRPFLFEGFYVPANSMAPTVLGKHFTVNCPTCGGPAFGSLPPPHMPATEQLVICGALHVNSTAPDTNVSDGDRILVAKYLRPRRWDVIAFVNPEDPSLKLVKRLIGLPGETVVIKDGTVWIDGRKLEPPQPLKGLNYVTEMPNVAHLPPIMISAGTPDRPAVIGPDEYFVLGDFSPQSLDSRLFKKGAPGPPPYAVPESYIIGVVTHVYWPPSRWRILR